ncbi:MAG: hypothetical protein MUD13_06785 [Candidatus Nanopelagicales bacterium]|jgi:hypothetical protein|nr:hypothetical protein [Candidatus Nanopelagicales bacterium]
MNKQSRAVAVLAAAMVVLAGCGDGGGEASPTPTASPTPSVTVLERATAALLPDELTPPAPPGTIVRPVEPLTAQGDEVAAPWAQFMVCPIVWSRPDEGPPTDVEPEALAGAWAFGVAGAAQMDQYAIVYAGEAAAQAAVSRAQAQADRCAALYEEAPEYAGDPPETTIGEVPGSVDGFRVDAMFGPRQALSTVMRMGDTVHFMRLASSGYETESGDEVEDPGGMLDAAWTEQVIGAAAEHLAG